MSVEEFSKQWAVDITVGGSYALPKWFDPQGRPRTFACRTTRVSPDRMMVEVPVAGKIGDHITPYFRDFGTFEGQISDVKAGRFLLELEMTSSMRDAFANKLSWIKEKQKDPSIPDSRRDLSTKMQYKSNPDVNERFILKPVLRSVSDSGDDLFSTGNKSISGSRKDLLTIDR